LRDPPISLQHELIMNRPSESGQQDAYQASAARVPRTDNKYKPKPYLIQGTSELAPATITPAANNTMDNTVFRKGRARPNVDNQMRVLEPIAASRNHLGLIFWSIPPALRTIHIEIEPIDAMKRQYGAVLVYGSILEPAGGSVVQNAETVVSNKPAMMLVCCNLSFISFLVVRHAGVWVFSQTVCRLAQPKLIMQGNR